MEKKKQTQVTSVLVDWQIECTPGVETARITFQVLPLDRPGTDRVQMAPLGIAVQEIERLRGALDRALALIQGHIPGSGMSKGPH